MKKLVEGTPFKKEKKMEEIWSHIVAIVFDAPFLQGNIMERVQHAKRMIPNNNKIYFVEYWRIEDIHKVFEWRKKYDRIGKGLILRSNIDRYIQGRNPFFLKVKVFNYNINATSS
jgi:hypothetical protein